MATTNARSPPDEPELLEDELELLEDELELLEDELELLEDELELLEDELELELELEDEELLEDDELIEGSVVSLPLSQPASATDANASTNQRENRFCFKFVIAFSNFSKMHTKRVACHGLSVAH
ncbi:hypothetical protein [Sorangium sp. So ce1000]|uniref:hypothetical protein n=1 Tax=Sorangium sp. So ce1000 TaxID=3133325 RepID=UPI003F63DEE8